MIPKPSSDTGDQRRPWDCVNNCNVPCCCPTPSCPLPCYFPPKCFDTGCKRYCPAPASCCDEGPKSYTVSPVPEEDLHRLLRLLMILPPGLGQGDLCLQSATWWDPATGTVDIQELLIAFGYHGRARNLDAETMAWISSEVL